MKKKSSRGYAGKHDPDARLDADIARALQNQEEKAGVSCKNAHAVADRLQKAPHEIGRALDLQNRRIIRCQLGLFGYTPRKRIVQPATDIAPDLADEIRSALVDGRLSCAAAWAMADRRRIERLEVAKACEALRIKISACQLGAF